MKDLEPNKLFAAVLVAGIAASLSGFVATKLTQPKALKENAFKIEGVAAAPGSAPVAEEKAQPILGMIATADTAKGQQIAKICASCHVFDKGGPNGLGPNLYGVVGRPKGSHPGFDYSDGMKKKGGDWTYGDLNKFIYKPKAYVEGTKMTFVGLKKADERAAVIAWLRTLADAPPALPTTAEIAADKAELAPADAATPKDTTSTAQTGAGKTDKAQPVTAPNASEMATPTGTTSGQTGATTVKPTDSSSATAAVPEGNGGTGAPQSSDDVKQGSKPADDGTEQTPQEKFDRKLPGAMKPRQPAAAVPAQQNIHLDKTQKVLPADKRDVQKSTGTKAQQQDRSDVGAGNSRQDLDSAPAANPSRDSNGAGDDTGNGTDRDDSDSRNESSYPQGGDE